MKLMKKLELMIMLCACVEGSLVSSSERWPAILISKEELNNFINNNDALEAYLDSGGNPNIYNLLGRSIYTNNFEMVLRLLAAGADIDLAQPEYRGDGSKRIIGYHASPLHAAIQGESIAMVKLLVENGADLSKKNINGDTPIDFAITEAARHPDDLNRIQIKNYLEEIAAHNRVFDAFIDEIPTAIAYQIHESDAHEYPTAEASLR
jgi:hypothetical protein